MNYVMAKLETEETLLISDLISQIPASPATVRRDLVELEKEGKIRKTRGKIFLHREDQTPIFTLRGGMRDEEKVAIGRAAAALVQEGDSIIIDSGTTGLAMAQHLCHFQHLSVITNSIPVAYTFDNTNVKTYVCGGMVADMSIVDDDAVRYFSKRKVDKAFLGASGVRDEQGLSVSSTLQFAVKRSMLQSANEVYGLIDSSKFCIAGINMFADFSELTGIVTSKVITNEKLLRRLDKLGTKIIYAE